MDNLLVAVSGGADSMYMLHTLKGFKNIHVAHVNYNYREDSYVDEKIVRDYCKSNNIQCHVLNVKSKGIQNFEAWARDVRYNFFNHLLNTFKLSKISTAHHKGDQAETLMIRIERGTGLIGLGGIRKETDKLVRPLLDMTKSQIYTECERLNIPFHEDYTNNDTKFKRNHYRHNVLNEEKIDKLCKIADTVQSIEKKMIPMLYKMYGHMIKDDGNTITIDKKLPSDDLTFILLADVFKSRFLLNSNIFENIFTDKPSMKKFYISKNVICNKLKKRTIQISFN